MFGLCARVRHHETNKMRNENEDKDKNADNAHRRLRH